MTSGRILTLTGLASLAMLFIAATVQKVWSADVWWQIKNGEWILRNLDVPTSEMYSWTSRGTPLREMRWLWCSALALAWNNAGAWALVVGQSALVGLTWTLVAWPIRRVLLTPPGLFLLALALLAGFSRWVVRPELMTYLLAAAFLLVLDRAASAPHRHHHQRALWLLPLLQVLWVNTHTTFLFGPVLAWTYAAAVLLAPFLQHIASRLGWARLDATGGPAPARMVIVALLVTGACWLNPYGHWGAMYALQMYQETSAEHATARVIGEMRSPLAIPLASWGWDLLAGAALIVLSAVATAAALWRARSCGLSRAQAIAWAARVVVLAMAAYLFLMLQRNTALAAVLSAFVGLRSIHELSGLTTAAPARGIFSVRLHAAFAPLIATIAWMLATDRYAAARDLPREFGLGVVEWYQPRGAADFLLKEKPQGPLFNVMRDGSYLVWRVSDEIPVYIDGRTDAYGPALLDELSRVNGGTWNAFAQARGINTALIPNRGYDDIARALAASPDWALVFLDHTSLVFVRRTPEHAPIIDRCAITPQTITRVPSPDTGPIDLAPQWKQAIGGVGRPWRTLGMAESLLLIDAVGPAKAYLERAMRDHHAPERARLLLAPIVRAEGRIDDSESLLAGLSDAKVSAADRESARLLMGLGKLPEAVEPLRRAVRHDQSDVALRTVLADVLFQTGDLASARAEYTIVLDLNPRAVNEWNKLGAACERLGDAAGAVRAYERSLGADPSQHMVWNMLGAAWGAQGDTTKAKFCFERALALRPDFEPAKKNLETLGATNNK